MDAVNLVRYHGCLAPHAKNRDKIVPKKQSEEDLRRTRGESPNRLLWAVLLARTFGLSMETCNHCGGRMIIVAAITDPASIKRYLDEFVQLSFAVKPARPPPQLELEYDDYEYIDEL